MKVMQSRIIDESRKVYSLSTISIIACRLLALKSWPLDCNLIKIRNFFWKDSRIRKANMRWLKMLNREEYGSPVCDVCGSKEATHILQNSDDVCCKSCAETESMFASRQISSSDKEEDYEVQS